MKLYWVKTHRIIKMLFRNFVWDVPTREKVVYLTFDDGPIPEITEWVLLQLEAHQAKATFFCIGNNINNNPNIFKKLIDGKHGIGNHTNNHLNGWKTATEDYLENVKQCELEMAKHQFSTKLFRPPYGNIKPSQSKKLRDNGYKIIMWDILSVDYDVEVTPEKCLENVLKNVTPGSIIIFHDSVKAFRNLEYVLPKTLDFLKENGYKCKVVS